MNSAGCLLAILYSILAATQQFEYSPISISSFERTPNSGCLNTALPTESGISPNVCVIVPGSATVVIASVNNVEGFKPLILGSVAILCKLSNTEEPSFELLLSKTPDFNKPESATLVSGLTIDETTWYCCFASSVAKVVLMPVVPYALAVSVMHAFFAAVFGAVVSLCSAVFFVVVVFAAVVLPLKFT